MGRKVLEVSNLGKKKLISTLCSLLLVVTGIFATTAFAACSTTAQQNVQVTPTPAQRGRTEAPETDHGAQVNKQAQTHIQKNPWGVAVDNAHGFIWVAEPGCDFPEVNVKCPTAFPGMIAKFSLADGTLLGEYAQPTGYSSPAFVAVDNTGNIWFSEPTTDAIGKFDPVTLTWSQWKLGANTSPFDLVFDKNGNLWFTLYLSNQIGFMDPKTLHIALNGVPTPISFPYGITIDPKGTLWFTENAQGASNVASFTPTTGGPISIYEHHVLSAAGGTVRPHKIVADKSGIIWYTEGFSASIGEYNPTTNSSTDYNVKTPCPSGQRFGCSHTSGIAIDAKGNIWFTDALGARIGYFVPGSGRIVTGTLPDLGLRPHDGIAIDVYGTVWFAEQNGFQLDMWPSGKTY